MENLQAVAGAGQRIVVNGREWQISQLTCGDYAELAEKIGGLRPDPLVELRKHARELPEAVVLKLAEEAWRDSKRRWLVTFADVDDFIQTPEGEVYSIMLRLRHAHPGVTLEDARTVWDELRASKLEWLADILLQTNGLPRNLEAALKNAASRPQGGTPSSSKSSTVTQRKPSAGRQSKSTT